MLIPEKSKFEAAEGTKLGFTPEIVVKEKLVATLTVKRHQNTLLELLLLGFG